MDESIQQEVLKAIQRQSELALEAYALAGAIDPSFSGEQRTIHEALNVIAAAGAPHTARLIEFFTSDRDEISAEAAHLLATLTEEEG
jgi:hypothetical protein